jgi:uncharacterized protein
MLLKRKYRQILLNIFSELTIPVEIWAYGSRVNGTAHEGSDLDLVLITPNHDKVPLDILLEIKEKISESNIPILVELFDWARLPGSFRSNIEACHEIFWSVTSDVVNDPETDYKKSGAES